MGEFTEITIKTQEELDTFTAENQTSGMQERINTLNEKHKAELLTVDEKYKADPDYIAFLKSQEDNKSELTKIQELMKGLEASNAQVIADKEVLTKSLKFESDKTVALKLGVNADSLSDVLLIAGAKVTDKIDLTTAIKNVLETHKTFGSVNPKPTQVGHHTLVKPPVPGTVDTSAIGKLRAQYKK